MNKSPEIRVFPDEPNLVRGIAASVDERVLTNTQSGREFHLALTGGGLGIAVTEALVEMWNQNPEAYAGLHVWWGDERFVPALSAERNASPVVSGLNQDVPIHIHSVLSADSGVDLDTAARRYNADLFGVELDLTLLGIGPDGHVASLFPGQLELDETRAAIPIAHSPKPPSERVSLSMAKINSSRAVWLIVSGSEKSSIVQRVIDHDTSIPASHVHGGEETLLLVDGAVLGDR